MHSFPPGVGVVRCCHQLLIAAVWSEWRCLRLRVVEARVAGDTQTLPAASLPQGWPLEKQRAREIVSKNGPPLPTIQWGALKKGYEQDGSWEETLLYYSSHRVILSVSVTGFLFTSGQLSGEIISVGVCSSEDWDEVQLHAAWWTGNWWDFCFCLQRVCLLGLHPWLQLDSYSGVSVSAYSLTASRMAWVRAGR